MSKKRDDKESLKSQKPRKQRGKINYKFVILTFLSLLMAAGFLLVAFVGITLAQNYQIDESLLDMAEITTIHDKDGNEVTQFAQVNRQTVSIDEIPDYVKHAFVAVEDQRFYEHRGFDLRAIARAIYRDIIARKFAEGGSTITQQLAKNIFLTHDRNLMRKTEEVLIAVNLERRYSKDEILEMYLNFIWFGHGANGIQAAAQTYFGKDVQDLELSEAALLAGLPRAPGHYSPLIEENKDRSEQRRKLVLALMEEQGYITAEEREQAADAELKLNTEAASTKNPAYDTLTDMVIKEAEEKYDIDRDELETGGYHIYTSVEANIQETMYEAFRLDSDLASELFPPNGNDDYVQGSMVIMDQYTGGVAGIMGGRDYIRDGLNLATTSIRDAGSSFKPISVYAPALDLGWEPNDMLTDEEIAYGGGYTPRNLGGQYRGQVSMTEALKRSLNAPAAWLLDDIGLSTGVSYVEAFGFEVDEQRLGIALGNIGASSLQMAQAFSTFPNEGMMAEAYVIERIEDRNGDVVAEHEPEFNEIINEQAAWYMTEMLQKAVQEDGGTGRNAQFNHPVAGKTGTVQDNDNDGNRDAWFVGYTPYYTAAVWMGFDSPDQNHVMQSYGGDQPALLFRHVMEAAHEGKEVREFSRPDNAKPIEKPVSLSRVNDLKAFLTLNTSMNVQVDLEFSASNDDRVTYNVYRSQGGNRSLVGENVSGGSFTDQSVRLGETYEYEVTPVNTTNGEEGDPSNRAAVRVAPDYPFFRRSEGVDEESFQWWLYENGFRSDPPQFENEEEQEEESEPPAEETEEEIEEEETEEEQIEEEDQEEKEQEEETPDEEDDREDNDRKENNTGDNQDDGNGNDDGAGDDNNGNGDNNSNDDNNGNGNGNNNGNAADNNDASQTDSTEQEQPADDEPEAESIETETEDE